MTNTYAVAKAATPGIEAPASPMMIKENSPRATSAVPARSCPRRATPSRRAANIPVATLVAAVTAARASATGSIETSFPGSTDRPIPRKKIVANKSRSGVSTMRARSAVSPVSVRPTRNAPTAADACSDSATAATIKVMPSTRNNNCSESG
ncbi:Uncharacterised protein [Mycobacterium tuberculosis]|uniref:Uncharacterized protein n=2 Tax=Mycobacterium tuberculosis TaxID=1773 RepID=A0A0T7LMV7_MYCTX|nr:Uncharacterised protein [Mycobacterium tuberculosis]CFE46546.1 Uncharacterised protein [Mycobacterium tuberculosis]CKQ15365.1 Uncharacterised protein [Mycobacterium tuberculosis]CNU47614.1 Uncharacterised protein [Mycobacterium tuberculosis]CNU63706.1 Uncharacterised protein [Mycobacterium tuberculosis]